jgi:hypothetical protein
MGFWARRASQLVHDVSWSTASLAVGLGVLILNGWSADVPVVSAMSLVALGATAITVDRYRGKWLGEIVVALNLVMYFGLYVLFVGSTVHRATSQSDHRLGIAAAIDLAVSVLPLAIAMVVSCNALRAFEPTR